MHGGTSRAKRIGRYARSLLPTPCLACHVGLGAATTTNRPPRKRGRPYAIHRHAMHCASAPACVGGSHRLPFWCPTSTPEGRVTGVGVVGPACAHWGNGHEVSRSTGPTNYSLSEQT
jgi:hypothetical protein